MAVVFDFVLESRRMRLKSTKKMLTVHDSLVERLVGNVSSPQSSLRLVHETSLKMGGGTDCTFQDKKRNTAKERLNNVFDIKWIKVICRPGGP